MRNANFGCCRFAGGTGKLYPVGHGSSPLATHLFQPAHFTARLRRNRKLPRLLRRSLTLAVPNLSLALADVIPNIIALLVWASQYDLIFNTGGGV